MSEWLQRHGFFLFGVYVYKVLEFLTMNLVSNSPMNLNVRVKNSKFKKKQLVFDKNDLIFLL